MSNNVIVTIIRVKRSEWVKQWKTIAVMMFDNNPAPEISDMNLVKSTEDIKPQLIPPQKKDSIRPESPATNATPKKRQKNTETDNAEELENDYQFFRTLVKNNIFKLKNVTDQRIASTWLHKCDVEEDKSLRCAVIKLMLVSLQHTGGNISFFRHPAPTNLPYIKNTSNSLNELVEFMLNDDAELTKYAKDDQPNVNQTAAVSSDMTSYAASMTFDDCVQVFYARSDYTLDTWNLPPQIQVPVERRSPSEWERALSSCTHTINSGVSVHTVVVEVPVYLEDDGVAWKVPKLTVNESDLSPMEKKCRDLMSDQTTIGIKHDFQWYEHSKLNGYLRSSKDIIIDKEIFNHEKTQIDLDEQAVNVINRVFPDRVRLILDPRLIFEVTKVQLNPIGEDHFNLNAHLNTLKINSLKCSGISAVKSHENAFKTVPQTQSAGRKDTVVAASPKCDRSRERAEADDKIVAKPNSRGNLCTKTDEARESGQPLVSCRCAGGTSDESGTKFRCTVNVHNLHSTLVNNFAKILQDNPTTMTIVAPPLRTSLDWRYYARRVTGRENQTNEWWLSNVDSGCTASTLDFSKYPDGARWNRSTMTKFENLLVRENICSTLSIPFSHRAEPKRLKRHPKFRYLKPLL